MPGSRAVLPPSGGHAPSLGEVASLVNEIRLALHGNESGEEDAEASKLPSSGDLAMMVDSFQVCHNSDETAAKKAIIFCQSLRLQMDNEPGVFISDTFKGAWAIALDSIDRCAFGKTNQIRASRLEACWRYISPRHTTADKKAAFHTGQGEGKRGGKGRGRGGKGRGGRGGNKGGRGKGTKDDE